MSDPYRPIHCSLHDELESLATLGVECRLVLHDEHGTQRVIVDRITDVFAMDGEERLTTTSGEAIRLDRIDSVERF